MLSCHSAGALSSAFPVLARRQRSFLSGFTPMRTCLQAQRWKRSSRTRCRMLPRTDAICSTTFRPALWARPVAWARRAVARSKIF